MAIASASPIRRTVSAMPPAVVVPFCPILNVSQRAKRLVAQYWQPLAVRLVNI